MDAQMMSEMAHDSVTFEPLHNEHQVVPIYRDAAESKAIRWTSRGNTFGPPRASSRTRSSPRPDGKYHPSATTYKPPFEPLSSLPLHSTMPTSGHAYFIINKKSGTAFDLSGEDQRSVIGFTLHRGENQKVRSIYSDSSMVMIIVDLIPISL